MKRAAAPLHTFEKPNHPSHKSGTAGFSATGRLRGASYHDSAEHDNGTVERRLHSVGVRGTTKKRGQSIIVGMRCPTPHNTTVAGSGRPAGGLRPNRPVSGSAVRELSCKKEK